MAENKPKTINNIFDGSKIRSVWDGELGDYYFSVVDVIAALTDNNHDKSRNYWKWLKNRLKEEGSQLVSDTNQLKLQASDGKFYFTDTLDTEGVLRLIESIPSPRAEPFKMWLAKIGKERINEEMEKRIGKPIVTSDGNPKIGRNELEEG